MADHNILGKKGEEAAVQYLLSKGYTIKARNWRYHHQEIDIIAEADDHLAIVEVKTRATNTYGNPQEFISAAKQKHLVKAANAYVEEKGILKDIQFDVISVIWQPAMAIEHIREAFYP